ncbi:MAG: riboflavin biosynthesis protein RibF [Victivallales bacterium]|nr:riboflavin biosynthesis protein RibF [Victivallales bacterium]
MTGTGLNVSSLGELVEHGINRVSIAAGVFDGVHLGHQLLLKRLTEMAQANGSVPVAMTFYPHPRAVLTPHNPPPLLISPEKRIGLLHRYGMQAVVTLSFSHSFAAQSPEDFIRNCLRSPDLQVRGLCVGSNWRFGANGAGQIGLLEKMAQDGHFDFAAVGEYVRNGAVVSSTGIRRAIAGGQLAEAEAMLGRPYSLTGIVERGHQDAGRDLNYPTANLDIRYGVMPPCGVYAGRAFVGEREYVAAVNIGTSPTYNRPGPEKIRLEAHVVNFAGDLYGRNVEVELWEYLREERCFFSPAELKRQIAADLARIMKIAESRSQGGGE